MAASTASRVISRTLGSLRMTRDTVIGETCANLATSMIVAPRGRRGGLSKRRVPSGRPISEPTPDSDFRYGAQRSVLVSGEGGQGEGEDQGRHGDHGRHRR